MEKVLTLPGDGSICSVAIIRNEEGNILLGLRHYKKIKDGTTTINSVWTTPGGRADVGEHLGDCLIREVREEVGIEATPTEYIGELPGVRKDDAIHIFLCSFSGVPTNNEPEKFETWDWFALADIPENFINPSLKVLLQEKLS